MLLITLFCGGAMAQPSLSVKVFPSLSLNRLESESDTLKFRNDGTGLRFGFGLIADLPLTENYYFSTGVSYISKKAGMKYLNVNDISTTAEVTNLRYLQIPVSLKLYTNEMSLDTRFYFQVGMLAEFKVGQNEIKRGNMFVDGYNFFDTSLLFGIGAERKIGTTTAAYIGFSYQRGLINVINDTVRFDDEVTLKNSLLAFEAGIRF
jgi:hypothetical protein